MIRIAEFLLLVGIYLIVGSITAVLVIWYGLHRAISR